MNYKEAIDYIEEIGKKGSVLGLTSVRQLLKMLGNPQDTLSVIHVAGTNGKGSICSFLEAMYQADGKVVGRYISPTLHTYLERFQIDGKYMSKEMFAQIMTEIFPILEEMKTLGYTLPTAFELETVIAFLFFQKSQVDLVILETGMGGREDATNVLAKPLCTVFASIALDHMQFLGDTVEKIALEKAGIMKDSCPAVVYPNPECVCDVLRKEAEKHHVMPLLINKDEIVIENENLYGSTFQYQGQRYEISLAGTYQIYNAVTAIACKLMLDGYVNKESLRNVKWEGRFELLASNPLFVRDGAHNMDGANALLQSIQKHFTNKKIIFIIGVLRDKEYEKMMQLLCPKAACVYTITPNSPRGLDAKDLQLVASKYCERVMACEQIKDAIAAANVSYQTFENDGQEAVIIAWGSLSYIGQLKELLEEEKA